ncbi:MAG: endonuclease/exonuclease/phosphatase family protein [Treponema sp.]|jgi:exonuclease III|nr:endonuclease/exonuclease/phosphatase family protein [Treponema sp.]
MIKHFFGRIIAAVLFVSLWACSAAKPEPGAEQLIIASWNVQNLFDGLDNGFEYDEFKNSEGWNEEKYRARLNSITGAMKGDGGFNPDILALIEVENSGVVRDLAEAMGFLYTFFAGFPESSMGMGILSKLPLTGTRVHSYHSSDGSIPRPVAEVWAETQSGPLALLVCHWKSKLGGEKNTEALRRAGAALVVRRLLEIDAERPGTPVIIMGDLNENHNEFDRIEGTYRCALFPDTSEAAMLAGNNRINLRPGFQDFLVLSNQKPPRAYFFSGTGPVPEISGLVYSPWMEREENSPGSFFYKDTWETIDHFLLNAALFGNQGWEYKHFLVLAEPPFANGEGRPRTYNPKTGNGLSDHFPIILVLNKTPQ